MARQLCSGDKSTIACGLLAASMGLFYLALSLGAIHVGGRPPTQESTIVGFSVGLAFLAGGLAVVIQTIEGVTAGADGSFSPGTSAWVRWSLHGLALIVTVCLAAIGLWVAFGPGPRQFSTNIPFISARISETLGRAVFGFGAILICLVLLIVIFEAALRWYRQAKA